MKIYNSHSQPVLSISLFFQNNNNFDQSDLFLSKKHNIDWEALFSISSEVSNDWLPFSCVVYNLQSVQADKSFSSNELLNSRRERYNRRRDCFSADFMCMLNSRCHPKNNLARIFWTKIKKVVYYIYPHSVNDWFAYFC